MPGAMDLCSFGFVLSFRNKIDSLKKAWRCIRVSLCFFVLLLYVFDIFRSVLTNYKMILLLSIQFHGFRFILISSGILNLSANIAWHSLNISLSFIFQYITELNYGNQFSRIVQISDGFRRQLNIICERGRLEFE